MAIVERTAVDASVAADGTSEPRDAEAGEASLGSHEAARPRALPLTTEREVAAFEIIRAQLSSSSLAHRTVYDPGRRRDVNLVLSHMATSSYFGVYLNKPAWWFARLALESRRPWVGFDLAPERVQPLLPPGYALLAPYPWAPTRVPVQGPGDLHALAGVMFAAIQDVIDRRGPRGPR